MRGSVLSFDDSPEEVDLESLGGEVGKRATGSYSAHCLSALCAFRLNES